jgi:hypothetical protein
MREKGKHRIDRNFSAILAGCGKTRLLHNTPRPTHAPMSASEWRTGCAKRLLFSPAQPRRAETRRSAGKAAVPNASPVTHHASHLPGTPLADFFRILLGTKSFSPDKLKSVLSSLRFRPHKCNTQLNTFLDGDGPTT